MQPEVVIDGGGAELREIVPRVVELPAMEGVADVAFSVDGESLYVVGEGVVLDWGVVAVDHGRAVLWVVVGLLLVLAIVWAWRAMWRRGRKGVLHCRGCWYEVEAMVASGAERCSECGLEFAKRRPVKGLGVKRRVAPAVAMGVVAVGLAGAMFVPAVVNWATVTAQAQLGVSRWWAERLSAWGVSKAKACCTEASVLVEIDPATGAAKRAIGVLPETSVWSASGPVQLIVMPDGAHVLLVGDDAIRCHRLSNGSLVSKLDAEVSGNLYRLLRICYGFCDGGAAVLVDGRYAEASQDLAGECTVLAAWNPFAGTYRELLRETDKLPPAPAPNEFAWHERGWLSLCEWSESGEPLAAIWYVHQNQIDSLGPPMAERIDLMGGSRTLLKFDEAEVAQQVASGLAFRRDGVAGYSTWHRERGIVEFDPMSGEARRKVKGPIGVLSVFDVSLWNDERWLVVRSEKGTAVFDLERKRWIANLDVPSKVSCGTVKLASNARRAAAAPCPDGSNFAMLFVDWPAAEILIWETGELLEGE